MPTRELAEQNERAMYLAVAAEDVGVVCSALGRNEVNRPVIIGTPQSLANRLPYRPVDLVIVDEAHQMPLHKGSQFAKLFDALPGKRKTPRAGLSATTFRTADGAIFGGPKSWFTCQPFEMSVADLMSCGHLARVRYVKPEVLMTVKGVQKSAGDYNQSQLVAANMGLVQRQADLVLDQMEAEGRRKAMVFAVTVDHATAFEVAFRQRGVDAVPIVGNLDPASRRANVAAFKAGEATVAVTVQAALTGFDVPDIDLIASCRPTMSAIIHTQSIGRGTRPAEGKRDLLVMDFAGNVPAFGPVEAPNFDGTGQPRGSVAPWRACGACGTYNHFDTGACLHCGEALKVMRVIRPEDLEFGAINWREETRALERLVEQEGYAGHAVQSFAVHGYRKKSDPNSISLMVSFALAGGAVVREWHKWMGRPEWKARWKSLGGEWPAPASINEAYARRAELVRPVSVGIGKVGDFWRVVEVSHEGEDEGEAVALEAAE
ncbi:DNA or RNA helicase of superfamily II [Stappia sp. 22II-S9-Z10]|nr:DNA or RNA helicase of superfamily II [Stappia sp. 22II-S9-Z10]